MPQARRRLARLNLVLLAAFTIIALAAAYWTVLRGPSILNRSDNPRLVEAELRIQRGDILDANSLPLATTSQVDGVLRRDYPVPEAAPAVGYYSLRYGTAGIEQAYDAYLRGEPDDFWSNLWQIEILGEEQSGHDLRLTIDSRWQQEAASLLGDRNGAVLLFSLPDMAIRAMVSSPGFDPNRLDSDFEVLAADQEAPLLNRVTQGQYQPGMLLQPFIVATAARDGLIDLEQVAVDADEVVVVDGVSLSCQTSDDDAEITWALGLTLQCPGPMLALGQELGAEGLLEALAAFQFTDQPEIPSAVPDDEEGSIQIDEAGKAAIGQDVMAISPLQVGIGLAALANDGEIRQAQLLAARQDDVGHWETIGPAEASDQAVPALVARQILAAAFLNQAGLLERQVSVLSGPQGQYNSWYLGLGPAADPRYGVVVVVEDELETASAAEIGRSLLKSVLDPAQS